MFAVQRTFWRVTRLFFTAALSEAYMDFYISSKPLVTTMGISGDNPLVDSVFGKVQAGSIPSYQQPLVTISHIINHHDTPPYPSLPKEDCRLDPTD